MQQHGLEVRLRFLKAACLFLDRLLGNVLVLIVLVVVLLPGYLHAETSPEHYKIGAYITSIHHIDTVAGTFDADLWIWSVGSSPSRDPLQTMEFVNSERLTRRLQSTIQRGVLFWRQAKIVGSFRQDWDLRRFPFDTQVLNLILEEGADDATAVIYDPDTTNTAYSPEASPRGWRITNLKVQAGTIHYRTNFGDPVGGNGADYARLHLAITLKRASLGTFLNLAAPLYAAFLLCAVSFLLHSDGRALVESRVPLLAASLFAVVINMRSVSAVLGSEHHLTVLDRLHIVVLVDIVIATFVTIAASIARDRSRRFSRWFDYVCCFAIVLTFAAMNVFLIAGAVKA